MKKKLIISASAVGVFVLLTVIITGGIMFYKQSRQNGGDDKNIKTSANQKTEGETVVCNYADDQKALSDSVENRNINTCDCIKENTAREECYSSVVDVMTYKNAIDQLDELLCDEVSSDFLKKNCHKIVNNKVDEYSEDYPGYLASVYLKSHNNEKAIEVLEKVVKNDKNNSEALVSLAMSYAEQGLKMQEKGEDHSVIVQKALNTIGKAKLLDEKNSEVYRVEGYIYEIKPNYEQAMTAYDEAIKLNKNNALAYAGQGHVFRMMGVLDKAVELLNKAASIDVDNKYQHIYTNLCSLENSRSNNKKTIENCNIVIKAENFDPVFKSEAHQIMASVFMNANQKDYKLAKKHLMEARSLVPIDANLFVTMAKLDLLTGRYDEAEKNVGEAIKIAPTKAMSYLVLSKILYAKNSKEAAIEAAKKGLELADEDVSLLTPSKPAIKRDLYYIIADSYDALGDKSQKEIYRGRGDMLFQN